MNANHQNLCGGPDWADYLRANVLSTLVSAGDLGERMLELGPGPGAATDWLRQRVRHLVAVEVDRDAAEALAARYVDGNVTVRVGDCTATGLPTASFDSVGSFTMLHHLPTTGEQRAMLAEAFRVLVPGGVFLGSDSLASVGLHHFHVDDTYNPIDPARLLVLLQAEGFYPVTVTVGEDLTFRAVRPR